MDREARNRIQSATQSVRTLLENEFSEQLEGLFDIGLDGAIAEVPGGHLDDAQRVLRASWPLPSSMKGRVESRRQKPLGRTSARLRSPP